MSPQAFHSSLVEPGAPTATSPRFPSALRLPASGPLRRISASNSDQPHQSGLLSTPRQLCAGTAGNFSARLQGLGVCVMEVPWAGCTRIWLTAPAGNAGMFLHTTSCMKIRSTRAPLKGRGRSGLSLLCRSVSYFKKCPASCLENLTLTPSTSETQTVQRDNQLSVNWALNPLCSFLLSPLSLIYIAN